MATQNERTTNLESNKNNEWKKKLNNNKVVHKNKINYKNGEHACSFEVDSWLLAVFMSSSRVVHTFFLVSIPSALLAFSF